MKLTLKVSTESVYEQFYETSFLLVCNSFSNPLKKKNITPLTES